MPCWSLGVRPAREAYILPLGIRRCLANESEEATFTRCRQSLGCPVPDCGRNSIAPTSKDKLWLRALAPSSDLTQERPLFPTQHALDHVKQLVAVDLLSVMHITGEISAP